MRNNVRNMRNSSVLTALFPQIRQGVLAATLGQPDKWWYLSELAGRLGTSPSRLKRFGNNIQSAFIYGSVARSREHAMSDVDVMVIGRAGLADLSPALRKAEARLGREVNVTAYSPEEFREKIKSGDHFLAAVLRGRKRFVKGGQSDLDELVGK